MPRPLRLDPPGTWHHVMNRGARRQTVFLDRRDHVNFLELLGDVENRFGVEVHLFCLVGNHFHALVRSRDGRISEAMKFVSERFTRWFNDRHGFDGPIFRSRFHSETVSDDAHHRWLFRYIHRNARDAGWLGPLAAFPWSSLGGYLNVETGFPSVSWLRTDFFLELFDHDRARMLKFLSDDASRPDAANEPPPQPTSAFETSDDSLTGWVIGHALDQWGLTMAEMLQAPRGTCSEARMAVALVLVDRLCVRTSMVASELTLAGPSSCRSLLKRARKRSEASPEFTRAVQELTERTRPLTELAA